MSGQLEYHFDHVHVFCSDLNAMERWFVEGLGAERVARRESRGVPAIELKLGGARLLLRGAWPDENLASPGGRRFGTDHFGLRVADVDAAIAELRRRGVTIDVEPWDISPTLRIAFVKGPDNVRIELLQPKPAAPTSLKAQ